MGMEEMVAFVREQSLAKARRDIPVLLMDSDDSRDDKLSLMEILKDHDQMMDKEDVTQEERDFEHVRKDLERAKFKIADANDDGNLDADEYHVFNTPGAN